MTDVLEERANSLSSQTRACIFRLRGNQDQLWTLMDEVARNEINEFATRVNKQRPSTKTGAIPLARRWAFTLRLLIPFPGLGSFSRSYVRSCRRSSAAGLAVQAGITGLQFSRNLSPPPLPPPHRCRPRRSLPTFVQFDLSRAITIPRA